MKKYLVKSLPIAEVFENLAKEMNCSYQQNCSYYKLSIPKQIGSGTIVGIQFDAGFAMLNYDCNFRVDTKIEFTYDQVHPIKFIHCHSGSANHYFEGDEQAHLIEMYENIVVASRKETGHVLEFFAGTAAKLCSLEIDRSSFKDKIACLLENEEGPIVKAIKDSKAEHQYYQKGKYNLAISNMIEELTLFSSVTLSTLLLKEGQSYIMLSYQWLEFKDKDNKTILDRYEYQMFHKIVGYITEKIDKTITLSVLSQKFFVSSRKIQKLFNTYVGKTVSKYIQDYRLEKSLELLANPENNISEVVYQLGLKNRSYFTRVFKERYSVTPSKFVENIIDK